MENTRAHTSQNNQDREDEMDIYDDDASGFSVPEVNVRTFEMEINANIYREHKGNHKR